MARFKTVVDVATGSKSTVAFTPEEEAAADAQEAAYVAAEAAKVAEARAKRSVTPYQARVALLRAGKLGPINQFMNDPQTPEEAKLAWEYAIAIQRNSAFIAALGPALGMTEAEIDTLFDVAETVV